MFNKDLDIDKLNAIEAFHKELGIRITAIEPGRLVGEMPIKKALFAANGFVHAGSIVTLADTVAGLSTIVHLPEGAKSFTTLELKSNFLGASREGVLVAESRCEHMGRSTQVWVVEVRSIESGKKIALFTCTQLILS